AYQQSLVKLVAVAKDVEAAGKTGRRFEFLQQYHNNALASIQTDKGSMIMTVSTHDHRSSHLPSDVVAWPELSEETTINENQRRALIHLKLANLTRGTTPAQLKPWLYKDVLHCDLSDPYLGLQAALFDNYPFID
ncbi:MAG: hypothetical protein ABSE82_15625, partial [Nitrososphaerales archaeon]